MNNIIEILNKYYGYKSFRKGQEEIINNIINGNDVLAIMPTGGGKSICYQVPAIAMDGLTIVISPLISLMKDQVDSLNSLGIDSAYINSSLSNIEIQEVYFRLNTGDIKILYVAPERLEGVEFLNIIKSLKVSQIAVDEAHCVSQWGHDFRSSYKRIYNFIEALPKRPVVTAFTATATKEVREDILESLKLRDAKIFISGFDRENLKITVERGISKNIYILDYIEENKGESGLIYCSTRKEVDKLCDLLKANGINALSYHAGLSDMERKKNQEDFIYDKVDVMIATNAFGMGIDKPNIRYVIHYNMPKNIEGYYQEIGRAGRDGEKSECILLFSPGDVQTQKYIIETGTTNPFRKRNELEKLQSMIDLVYSNGCYKKYILNYFGEEREEDCNNCSNCLFDGELIDKTIDAQKVISCVYRMKRPFGIGVIVEVLRGSKNKKLIEQGLDKLTTYGIVKDYTKDELKDFINTLISHGYINYGGEFPVVTPNKNSLKVVKGEEKVYFKEARKVKKITTDNDLFGLLRGLRMYLAGEEGIPPYMVFGDNTLKEMSTRMPLTKEQLLDISGVGEKKVEKYGEKFIEKIKEYVDEKNIKVDFKFENDIKLPKATEKKKRRTTEKEKSYEISIRMLREGKSLKEVSKERGSTIGTISTHIQTFLGEGKNIDFNISFEGLFTDEEEKEILEAGEKVGFSKLTPIKEIVNKDISYDKIKLVILKRSLE
ncbi:DNA helicase RecQ [Clostridium thermobutyricum]|uniref:DNA helicase RecQ n=1 Tax=Clostridium thermobutyricum DSM 4928 TaxID=1121339 RepID=A0A1V4SYV4_9CLOT|nr:DNA helicase RecQ [Clostridium thermobutyricum]OPX50437.1 ATP-dependent DNA helicase RecQ [Clostridium thermobutyricum DSM 4928]